MKIWLMHRWYHFRLAGDYDGKYVQLIIVLVPGDVDFTAASASLGPHSSRLRHGPFMDPLISLFKDTSPCVSVTPYSMILMLRAWVQIMMR